MEGYKKAIHLICGSEGDLPHVRNVISGLKSRGWIYSKSPYTDMIRNKTYGQQPNEKICTAGAGSVHRDVIGTLSYAATLRAAADSNHYRALFLTCIGLRDEASGVISSSTGMRVIALPPDVKAYGEYPKGLRVTTFSSEQNRDADIVKALDWIENELDNPNWDADNEASRKTNADKFLTLQAFRNKITKGEIKF